MLRLRGINHIQDYPGISERRAIHLVIVNLGDEVMAVLRAKIPFILHGKGNYFMPHLFQMFLLLKHDRLRSASGVVEFVSQEYFHFLRA